MEKPKALVHSFSVNALRIPPFSMRVATGLSILFFIRLRYIPSSPTVFRVFLKKRCWVFVKSLL